MDGREPPPQPPGRRQAQFAVRIVVALLEGLLPAALAIGFLANTADGSDAGYSGPGAALALGLAVISLAVMIWLIVRAFRLARSPAGGHGAHAASRRASIRAGLPKMFRPTHRVSRREFGVRTLCGLAGLALLAAYGVALRSDADRSAYVQRFGVPVAATVVSVWNSGYQSRAWNHYSAQIQVQLARSVAGDTWSTAHYPAASKLADGEAVRVLVDPRDPGYAELPGWPYITSGPWIFIASLVGFGLLMIILSASATVVDIRRRRRGHRVSWGAA
jgi:hypothetical protein